jgi:hypothetical protein
MTLEPTRKPHGKKGVGVLEQNVATGHQRPTLLYEEKTYFNWSRVENQL